MRASAAKSPTGLPLPGAISSVARVGQLSGSAVAGREFPHEPGVPARFEPIIALVSPRFQALAVHQQPEALGELVEAGWPGEKIQREAAADRAYVAVSTLRQLGLRGVLVKSDDGYMLRSESPIAIVDEDEDEDGAVRASSAVASESSG